MWPAAGFTLVASGLAPSVWNWVLSGQQTLRQTTTTVYTEDTIFLLGAFGFLWVAEKYGHHRGPVPPAPYPGAWVEADGRQRCPRGFTPGYLSLALVITLIIPSFILTFSSRAVRPLANATLGPYLMVFIPQILLETRFLSRSFMTPMLPVLFMYYRLWQFIRSLGLLAQLLPPPASAGSAVSNVIWFKWYLLSLLGFWVFDTGCTIVWMPWMYNWQLQDFNRMQQLSRLREQHQQSQLLLLSHKGSGLLLPAKVSDTEDLHPGRTSDDGRGGGAAKGFSGAARLRRGGVGAQQQQQQQSPAGPPHEVTHHHQQPRVSITTDDYDQYGFGT